MSVKESFQNILKSLRSSHLNFIIQESPYSIYLYITIRKRFLKNSPPRQNPRDKEKALVETIVHLETLVRTLSEDNVDLELEVKNEKFKTKILKRNNEDLENEMEVIKKELKRFENITVRLNDTISEKTRQVETLKDTSKESNAKLELLKTDLQGKGYLQFEPKNLQPE